MTIIIFLIILGVLVFVHELGHFLVAKKAGVAAEEFGFGYPPRALVLGRKWGTLFTLNWIPFGGFVRILGENYEEKDENDPPEKFSQKVLGSPREGEARLFSRSFPEGQKLLTEVSRWWQAAILSAGIIFNIIFAWLLFSLGFMIGLPTPVDNEFGAAVKNPVLTIVGVLPDSPAQKAGLKSGDKIENVFSERGKVQNLTSESISDFVSNASGEIGVDVDRGGKVVSFSVAPQAGLVSGKKVIGIEMDMVGTLSLPIHKALYEGARATYLVTSGTVYGLSGLLRDAFLGKADVSQVTGPVGIIGLVGDASKLGFAYLISFASLISINLAIVNLVPFPALDGGRLLFVAIEGVTRKRINSRFVQTINTAGFALLIALMVFITYKDILKLF